MYMIKSVADFMMKLSLTQCLLQRRFWVALHLNETSTQSKSKFDPICLIRTSTSYGYHKTWLPTYFLPLVFTKEPYVIDIDSNFRLLIVPVWTIHSMYVQPFSIFLIYELLRSMLPLSHPFPLRLKLIRPRISLKQIKH